MLYQPTNSIILCNDKIFRRKMKKLKHIRRPCSGPISSVGTIKLDTLVVSDLDTLFTRSLLLDTIKLVYKETYLWLRN